MTTKETQNTEAQMKGLNILRRGNLASLAVGATVMALTLMPLRGPGQIVTLTDNNSIARVDVGSSAGMNFWGVQNNLANPSVYANQLQQQWFWYRTDSNPDRPINTISAPTITQPDLRTLYTTYTGQNFNLRVDYVLSGGSLASGKSDIGETIRIFNTSATALTFHLFQYSNFDLEGNGGNDTVQLGRNIRGLFNEAAQTDSTLPGNMGLTETVVTPGANRGEVAFVGGPGSTLSGLNSGTAYDLNNNSGPVGPGNVSWALQWDFTIGPGGSAIVSKDKYLQIPVIPEPAMMALAGLGLLLCVFRKRTS